MLGADRGAAGAGHLAQELRGQRHRAGLGKGPAVQRDLHAGVASLGAQVKPVQVGQLLAGDQPEPEVERHRLRIAGVVRQPLPGLEIGVLEDVVGIDPTREAAVEPEPDQPPQPVALGVEHRGERGLVAAHGTGQKDVWVGRARTLHQRRSKVRTCRIARFGYVNDVTTTATSRRYAGRARPWSDRDHFNTNRS